MNFNNNIIINSSLCISFLLQINLLFSQPEIKKNNISVSPPEYTVSLDYMELSILNSAMVDGVNKYKGNIEYKCNVKFEKSQVYWEISTNNKLVFEVLNLYVAQKSVEFIKIINIDNITSAEKTTLASLSSLSTKLNEAIENPIWKVSKISGILIYEGGQFYISTSDMKMGLSGSMTNELDSLTSKKVIALGVIREPDIFELKSIHAKKENTLELFIMSKCPFGIQALKNILDVTDTLSLNKHINLEVHYIFTKNDSNYASLHGEQEIVENIIQILIRDKFPQFFIEYLKQRISAPSESWQQIAANAKIDKKIIQQIDNEVTSNRNSIIKAEYTYMWDYFQQINSSPTFVYESEIINSLDQIPGFKGGNYSEFQKCINN